MTWADVTTPGTRAGVRRLEVVVDGWRFELDVEPDARAALMERARRERGEATGGGAAEVRAMIPGRVLAVAAEAGDTVEAGQRLLVIEAMKMQNEIRAPRSGVVTGVRVAAGRAVELGELLLTIGDVPASSTSESAPTTGQGPGGETNAGTSGKR